MAIIKNGSSITYTNSGNTAIIAGTPVVVGSIFGCAVATIPAGAKGTIETSGQWELPIASATTADLGAVAYWDSSDNVVTTTEGSNAKIGYFVEANVAGQTVAKVILK